jgi:hypothetical protein
VLVGFLKLPIDWETAFATFGDDDLLPPDVVKRLLLEQAELVYVTHDVRSSALTPSRSTTTTPTTDAARRRSVRHRWRICFERPRPHHVLRRVQQALSDVGVLPSESDLYRVYFC